MNNRFAWCVLMVGALLGTVHAATLKQHVVDGENRWIMENDQVRLEIAPQRGGRVSDFVDRKFPRSLVRTEHQGLFCDIPAGQNWPGELRDKPYKATALQTDGQEVALRLRTDVTGEFRKNSLPLAQGVVLTKTYRLRDGESELHVEHQLANPTAKPRQFALWVQNVQHLGEQPQNNVALRPARAGVYRFVMPHQPRGEAWQRYMDSIAAWQGVVDPESGQGVFYFQDWDYLEAHYNAGKAFSVEWFMAPNSIPPGESWTTHSTMASREAGVDCIAAAPSFTLMASLSEDERSIAMRSVADGDNTVHVQGTLRSVLDGQTIGVEVDVPSDGLNLPLPENWTPPVFLEGVASLGDDAVVMAEFFGGGSYPRNERLPGYPPMYQVVQPERHPVFHTPESFSLRPGSEKKILLVQGVMTPAMQVASQLESDGYSVTQAYEDFGQTTMGVTYFPPSYNAIAEYGTIVLNNIDTKLLSPLQQRMLDDYVRKAGGRLVVIAGTAQSRKNLDRNPLNRLISNKPFSQDGPKIGPVREIANGPEGWVVLLPESGCYVTWSSDAIQPLVTLEGGVLLAIEKVGTGQVVLCGLSGAGRSTASYWSSDKWHDLLMRLVAP